MRMTLRLTAVQRTLGVLLCALVLAGVVSEAQRHLAGSESDLIDYFSLSEESNVPTWYSSALLLANAGAFALIAATRGPGKGELRVHWAGLALLFLYMSIDEMVQIHEWLNALPPLQGFHGGLHGFLYFSWVIPAAIVVTLIALAYLPFLRRLPRATRKGLILAGAVYVGGAIGVELLLGKWTDLHGEENMGYALIDAVEEGMEIAGASILLSTLLGYLAGPGGELRVRFEGAPPVRPGSEP
jgi:hypothetical protein